MGAGARGSTERDEYALSPDVHRVSEITRPAPSVVRGQMSSVDRGVTMSRYRSLGALGIVVALCGGLLLLATPASATWDRTPPTTPGNLRITASTANGVSLAWNASTDRSTFWYCVQLNGSGCIRVDPPRTTLTYPGLLPNRTTTFRVYAIDSAGNRSANSNSVSFTTPSDTTPPTPVPVISVARLLPTRVELTWPQPVDDFSNQVFTTIFMDGEVLGYPDRLGPPSLSLLSLTPETSYEFQVSVRDRDGNRVTGPPLVVTTPAKNNAQAPTAPTGVLASSPDGLDLLVRWTASTDDADAQADIRYDVYVDGQLSSVGLSTRTWMSCMSADPVQIFVRAVDTSGNESAPSNTVLFDDCNP
jgi:chitodextrinase